MSASGRPEHFAAPWGWQLKASTAIVCFVIGVPAIYQLTHGRLLGVLLAVLLLSFIPLTIRGYTVRSDTLEIHRLGWVTRWRLDGLEKATYRPGAMARSWRTFGNGGAFAFHGHFRSGALGPFRAYVTDPARTVVLELASTTLVVSPDDPERFVKAVQQELRVQSPMT